MECLDGLCGWGVWIGTLDGVFGWGVWNKCLNEMSG